MLDFQTKINDFGAPTAFVDTQHDAEEFNATHEELVNAVEAARLTPTPLVDYLLDDTTQLTQSIVALSGLYFQDATLGGAPNARVLNPPGPSVIDLPPIEAMDGFTFKFTSAIPNTGPCTLEAFGETKDLKLFGLEDIPEGYIVPFGTYEVMWSEVDDVFYLLNKTSIGGIPWTPNGISDLAQVADNESAVYSINGDVITIQGFLLWTSIVGVPFSVSFDLPTIDGYQVRYRGEPVFNATTVLLCRGIFDGSTPYIFQANLNPGADAIGIQFSQFGGDPNAVPTTNMRVELNFSFPFKAV